MPVARSLAQIEAARRNGAKSRGPVSSEGKARSSRNALRHGLASPEHIILEGENEAAFAALHVGLIDEFKPETMTEAQLVHRLAIAFWKQARADRLEQKLFASTDAPRFVTAGSVEPGDPEVFFDIRRFNAIRGYQAQLGREISRCLAELRRLKATRAAESLRDSMDGNEPDHPVTSPAARPTLSTACTAPALSSERASAPVHERRPRELGWQVEEESERTRGPKPEGDRGRFPAALPLLTGR
jgi:hypothetical protein